MRTGSRACHAAGGGHLDGGDSGVTRVRLLHDGFIVALVNQGRRARLRSKLLARAAEFFDAGAGP